MKLSGKVALVTGAARGQGRSHSVELARQGADIIAIDICKPIDVAPYPMGTSEDLAETASQVEALDRQIVTAEVDVRDFLTMQATVQQAAAALGGLDIVVANAGILSFGSELPGDHIFREIMEVNLFGTRNTIQAAAPLMIEQDRGGSIVLISSTQGLSGRGGDGSGASDGYCASKHAVVGLMRTYAHWLSPHSIRVNSVHPTGVNTPMVTNEIVADYFASGRAGNAIVNLLPVPVIEPSDVSHAIAWLVSDEGRYVTGVTLPVDAGMLVS
jgi:SDR family mycofactocin-dependent oxidoreductase